MSRQKLKKFSENLLRENIIETGKPWFEKIKGNWTGFFGNDQPLILELACGRGEYTVGLAQRFQEKNHVGIDIKGDRIWKGSGQAMEQNLKNVAFLRTDVHFLTDFFIENEVAEIWLTFPDPRPKDKDERRRLTHPDFLLKYKYLLKNDGWFKFKTDNTALFDYTLEIISAADIKIKNLSFTYDLYSSDLHAEHFGIKTRYERMFYERGEAIKYLKFQFES